MGPGSCGSGGREVPGTEVYRGARGARGPGPRAGVRPRAGPWTPFCSLPLPLCSTSKDSLRPPLVTFPQRADSPKGCFATCRVPSAPPHWPSRVTGTSSPPDALSHRCPPGRLHGRRPTHGAHCPPPPHLHPLFAAGASACPRSFSTGHAWCALSPLVTGVEHTLVRPQR